MAMPIGDMLRYTALRTPGKTAMIDHREADGPEGDRADGPDGDGTGRRVSYGEMDADANRFADGLRAAGIGKGDRVAILSSNRIEYGVANYGIARSGAVACHLSFRATDRDIVDMIGLVEARMLVVEAPVADRIARLRDRLPSLRRVISIGRADGPAGGVEKGVDGDFATLFAGRSAAPPAVAIDPEDPLCITFTGGTTGTPKAAVASHRARGWTALAAAHEFGLRETDVMILPAPMFHTAGMCIWFQPGILVGATLVLMPRWDVAGFLDLVERHAVTAIFMVPTQLGDLLRDPAFRPDRLATVRTCDFAAAPMPLALFRRLRETLPWIDFVENYGSTEAGVMTVRKPWFNDAHPESVGRPVLCTAIEIVDGDGRPVPPGTAGEIVQSGGGTFSGYLGDSEQTAQAFRRGDGRLWTGDIGRLDEDGFLYLVDRARDMIISGGENLFPKEIEDALHSHPAVGECAVFGIPDERLGEAVGAHVVLRPGAMVDEDALIAFCAGEIARHKRPRMVRFVDSLPRSAVGKVLKAEIRAGYWPSGTAARRA